MINQKIWTLFLMSISLAYTACGLALNDNPISKNEKTFYDVFKKAENTIQQPFHQAIKYASSIALGTAFWFNLSYLLRIIKLSQTYVCSPSDANPQPRLTDREEKKGFYYNKGVFLTAMPALFIMRYFFKKIQECQLAQEEQKIVKEFLEGTANPAITIPSKLKSFLNKSQEFYQKNPNAADLAQITRLVKAFLITQEEKHPHDVNGVKSPPKIQGTQ